MLTPAEISPPGRISRKIMVRGVIDIYAFIEDGQWIIVDYKTDHLEIAGYGRNHQG